MYDFVAALTHRERRGFILSAAGFKLFTRDTAALVFESLHLQRWAFDIELIYICQLMAIPMAVSERPPATHQMAHDFWPSYMVPDRT